VTSSIGASGSDIINRQWQESSDINIIGNGRTSIGNGRSLLTSIGSGRSLLGNNNGFSGVRVKSDINRQWSLIMT
jgi:hypothetical protein